MNIKVTFGKEIKINGQVSTPHHDGNNGRHIYIANGYVLKIDDRGYNHNDQSVWKRIKRKDRKYFVPTLAQGVTKSGNRWSIQPYVELDWDITHEDAQLVADLCDKYDLHDIDTWETSCRNWALNANTREPIIFDYGLGAASSDY